jgi:hypothetical protein
MNNNNKAVEAKNIKDYLHLYLGCEIQSLSGGTMIYTLTGIGRKQALFSDRYGNEMWLAENDYKPILRPLSSMTEDEKQEYEATRVFVRATPVHQIGNMQWTPETFKYLLSKHFDLFGLIEAGLAIDKTTFKINNHGAR